MTAVPTPDITVSSSKSWAATSSTYPITCVQPREFACLRTSFLISSHHFDRILLFPESVFFINLTILDYIHNNNK